MRIAYYAAALAGTLCVAALGSAAFLNSGPAYAAAAADPFRGTENSLCSGAGKAAPAAGELYEVLCVGPAPRPGAQTPATSQCKVVKVGRPVCRIQGHAAGTPGSHQPSATVCTRWDISGRWQINQRNAQPVFDLRQNGNKIDGQATSNGITAPVHGSLINSKFDVLVTWSNDSKGRYTGTVGPGMIFNGEGHDEMHPESRTAWSGTGPAHCVQ